MIHRVVAFVRFDFMIQLTFVLIIFNSQGNFDWRDPDLFKGVNGDIGQTR